jgi:DNA-binding transcriptional LysR family regulator
MSRGVTFERCGGQGEPVDSFFAMPSRPVLATASTDTKYACALHGLGISGLPSFVAGDALMEHALERVLPEWRLYSYTLWAAMPSRKFMPARTRVFLDFLLEVFGGKDEDPWLAAAGCPTWRPAAPAPDAPAEALPSGD